MLSVIMLGVVMLSIGMFIAIILSVIMPGVSLLSVLALQSTPVICNLLQTLLIIYCSKLVSTFTLIGVDKCTSLLHYLIIFSTLQVRNVL
jgi:hypothetical protein